MLYTIPQEVPALCNTQTLPEITQLAHVGMCMSALQLQSALGKTSWTPGRELKPMVTLGLGTWPYLSSVPTKVGIGFHQRSMGASLPDCEFTVLLRLGIDWVRAGT